MRKVGAVFAAVAVVSILSVTPSAFAGDKALAEELFRKAQSVLQRPGVAIRDTHRACQWLKESLDQDAAINTQVALAACYEKEGKTRSAWGLYSDAASQVGPAAAYAKERADALYKVGFLHMRIQLSSAPDGTKVLLDDASLGAGALNTEIAADPGDHVLKVTAPGKKDVERRFALTKDLSPLNVPIVLENAPVEPPVVNGAIPPPVVVQTQIPASPMRALGFIVGGVGIAALVGGLVSEILAQVFDANRNKLHQQGQVAAEGQEQRKAVAAQSAAIGLAVGGGVFFVAGVVLYFVGAPKAPASAEAKTTWRIVPGVGGASVVGTF